MSRFLRFDSSEDFDAWQKQRKARLSPTSKEEAVAQEKPNSKYRNKKTTVDGLVFDSLHEAQQYQTLRTRERLGEIQNLRLQVPFALVITDRDGVPHLICEYRADYVFEQDGKFIVADAKGYRTREYILKRKLMRAILNIDIVEL